MQPPSDQHVHPSRDPGSPDGEPASGTFSLFLAGSRQRLLAASGVVAVLWCLVWWALD